MPGTDDAWPPACSTTSIPRSAWRRITGCHDGNWRAQRGDVSCRRGLPADPPRRLRTLSLRWFEPGLADGGDVTFGDHSAAIAPTKAANDRYGLTARNTTVRTRHKHRRDRAEDHGSTRTDMTRLDVAPETRVALELLFDLSQNALFIF